MNFRIFTGFEKFWIIVQTRLAHFSHFSREREMVLRDISREKCGARNCEKKEQNSGHFEVQFDQNQSNFPVKATFMAFMQTVSVIQIRNHDFFQLLISSSIIP